LIAWRGTPETCPPIVHTARQPIRWGRNWILLLTVTLVTGASWAMVSPVLIIFLQEHFQVGVDIISWAFLPSGRVWALLPARLGKLADRFGRKPLMLLGMVMASASSFIVPHLGSILAFAALWGFQALCYAAGDPAEQALVADLTGGDQRGRAYGFYAMAADLGAALGPFAGTWLYQTLGASMPFYANGIVLALSALALFFLLGEPAQRQPQQDGSKGSLMEKSVSRLLTPQILQEAMQLFGALPGSPRLISDVENFVYETAGREAPFILRITHDSHRKPQELMGELDWMGYLSGHGMAVARPMVSQHGNLVENIETGETSFHVTAFHKIEGENIIDGGMCGAQATSPPRHAGGAPFGRITTAG